MILDFYLSVNINKTCSAKIIVSRMIKRRLIYDFFDTQAMFTKQSVCH